MNNNADIILPHLLDEIWACPSCHNQAVRFDTDKGLFVCWVCCKLWTEEEGYKRIDASSVEIPNRLGL